MRESRRKEQKEERRAAIRAAHFRPQIRQYRICWFSGGLLICGCSSSKTGMFSHCFCRTGKVAYAPSRMVVKIFSEKWKKASIRRLFSFMIKEARLPFRGKLCVSHRPRRKPAPHRYEPCQAGAYKVWTDRYRRPW